VQTEHTLEIKKIIAGGKGLGHLDDGMVVMTPFVLPGEIVNVAKLKQFSGHIQAATLSIEQPSPQRCLPLCPQFGTCGGCSLQHTPYSNQLAIKKEILLETLARGHVLPEKNIPPPLPSPLSEGYRYKIRLHLTKNGRIGFHKMQSHALVNITHCPLAAPALNTVLRDLSASGLLPEIASSCNQIELICSPGDTTAATLFLTGTKQPPRTLLETMLERIDLDGLMLQHKRQTTFIPKPIFFRQSFSTEEHHYALQWDNRSFFQINPQQNRQLIDIVLAAAGNVAGKKILDLFCGMGNFSIPLALRGAVVTAVELNKNAVAAARNNARNAKIHESKFIAADVGRYLRQLTDKQSRFDIVLLDPPRQGLGHATGLLAQTAAEMIVYISCDPATLTRDLKTLVKKYRLMSVTPVDMFPHTHHIECVAVLEKN
jgi:23S rRNA (uracil1939-C5)-methyltransferase